MKKLTNQKTLSRKTAFKFIKAAKSNMVPSTLDTTTVLTATTGQTLTTSTH